MSEIFHKANNTQPWLVVGQGLAGTVLALSLVQQGQRVVVVDAALPYASSRAAAGIYNPVTGKRRQLTWAAAELWPALEAFYPWAQHLLGASFFYPLPNIRPFFTALERAEAQAQAADSAHPLSAWIKVLDAPLWQPAAQVHAPYGVLVVPRSGYVDVMAFCHAARAWLVNSGCFIEALPQPADIDAKSGQPHWQGYRYQGVIWATGAFPLADAGWQALPLAPLKGEILHVSSCEPALLAGGVLNRAAYLAPRADGTLWAGSTYEHRYSDNGPTEAARVSILERVSLFYKPELQVLNHWAGIRPSVKDRRPLLGALGGRQGQYVFTGMGTKGVSLAPWCAGHMCRYLLGGIPLPAEVAVRAIA